MEYPKKLHNLHNDLPLVPDRVVVNKVEKLIPTLGDKKNYVLQWRIVVKMLGRAAKFHLWLNTL